MDRHGLAYKEVARAPCLAALPLWVGLPDPLPVILRLRRRVQERLHDSLKGGVLRRVGPLRVACRATSPTSCSNFVMPQPLRSWPKSGIEFSRGVVAKRPDLAIAIARIVAEWSKVEVALGNLLGIMLGTEAPIGAAMYLALTGSGAQYSALSAVADARLPTADLKRKFGVLIGDIRKKSKARNEVVHCMWLVCDEFPDALIHCPQENHVEDQAIAIRERIVSGSLHEARIEYIRAMKLYTAPDFADIEQRVCECNAAIYSFIVEFIDALPPGHIPPLAPKFRPQADASAARPRKRQTSPAKRS